MLPPHIKMSVLACGDFVRKKAVAVYLEVVIPEIDHRGQTYTTALQRSSFQVSSTG